MSNFDQNFGLLCYWLTIAWFLLSVLATGLHGDGEKFLAQFIRTIQLLLIGAIPIWLIFILAHFIVKYW